MTNAQISQKQDGHNVYVIIKTMCPLGYYHDGFVATHALVYIMYRSSWLWFIISSCMVHTIHHVPKCMSCHKEIMVITGGHIVFIITYKQKPSVCMCCTMAKVFFYYLVMSVNGETHNAYNFYIIKNTVTIVPEGNFVKETNNF